MASYPSSDGNEFRGANLKFQFTMTPRQYRLLTQRALHMGQSRAQVCREALDKHLAADERAGQLGFQASVVVRRLPQVLRRIHPRLTA